MTSAIYQELSERAAVIYEKVVMWRRDFHRYPELAGHESGHPVLLRSICVRWGWRSRSTSAASA